MPSARDKATRQHFLSRFYLELFADEDGRVWTTDWSRHEVRRNVPEKVARARHYDHALTDAFARKAEAWLAVGLKRLDVDPSAHLDGSILELAVLLLLHFSRGPLWRHFFMEETRGKLTKGTLPATEFQTAGWVAMTLGAEFLFLPLLQARWTLFRAPEGATFLTTDQPLVMVSIGGVPRDQYFEPETGFHEDVVLLYPVSKTLLAAARQKKPIRARVLDATTEQVVTHNEHILDAGGTFAVSSSQGLAEWALQRGKHRRAPKSPSLGTLMKQTSTPPGEKGGPTRR